MFGFLKDKLKGALGKFSKEVEKDAVVERKEILVEKPETRKPENKVGIVEEPKKKGFFQKIFGRKDAEEMLEEKEELQERAEAIIEEKRPERKIEKIAEKKTETKEEKPVLKPELKKNETKIEVKPVQTRSESYQKKQERKENKLSITINSPVANVFEFTINPKNTPLWIDDIISEETNESPVRLGTEYKNTNKKGELTRYEVVKLETNSVFQLKQKDSVYSVCYTYKPLSDNRTELIYLEWVDAGELVNPFSISTLEKLKKAIEKPRYQALEEKRAEKVVEYKEEEHKGFFTKITETFTKIQISEEKFEELFWELEIVLLENNVAVEVIDKIKRDLKKELMAGKVSRKGVDELITSTLRQSITELFDVEKINLIEKIKEKRKTGKPYIIAIIGVNGAGKTTSIAKLTHLFQKNNLKAVWAASDTFRAAAIQQLEEHANKLNVKMVKHDYNSDPAAVAFDAIKYAEAHGIDVVLIDTAGRLHSNTNLMRELEKVIRICKPDIKIFVGESITGNDCVEQAKEFDRAVGIDAIILAKADVDDKGGAAISVSYILQRPILYLGTGQAYDDLKEFDSKMIIESLEL